MKYKPTYNESESDRLERIRLSKLIKTKVIPDKTKYNRKDKHKKGESKDE